MLDALESNGNEFGQLVRDSYGLTAWFRQLQTSLADQGIDSATAAQTWCRKIVEACRNLQSIDFFCSTVNDFNSFSNAVIRQSPASSPSHPQQTLVHSFSGLRNLSFGSDRLFVIGIDFTNLFEALRRSSVVHLNSLQIMQVGWTLPTGQDPAISRFLLPVRELDILKETTTFASSVRFFPQDNSILEHFELEGNTTADGKELLCLPDLLGGKIKSLSLFFFSDAYDRVTEPWSANFGAPLLKLDTWSRFPLLISLTLSGTHGPSLALLQTLSKSSPLLRRLSFTSSEWVSSHDSNSTVPSEIFPNRNSRYYPRVHSPSTASSRHPPNFRPNQIRNFQGSAEGGRY